MLRWIAKVIGNAIAEAEYERQKKLAELERQNQPEYILISALTDNKEFCENFAIRLYHYLIGLKVMDINYGDDNVFLKEVLFWCKECFNEERREKVLKAVEHFVKKFGRNGLEWYSLIKEHMNYENKEQLGIVLNKIKKALEKQGIRIDNI